MLVLHDLLTLLSSLYYRVKELRRSTTSTSRSVNVAMSNILMNIPASAPSLFQPSNILCSSTPMRQSSKQFTNRGSDLNLDPSETPIRGPGARRKTSSAASRERNSSVNTSTNKNVSSRTSVVRHVAPQTAPVSGTNKQNLSSNSESDQTDTDSNNITGPQKPINIALSAHNSNFQNIPGPKKISSNVLNANVGQNIPVVKSTDTENDFPTTDFNDELNDLNRTGDKQNVAASVPVFSAPVQKQTGSQETCIESVPFENSQHSSVSASVPVLQQKLYDDRLNKFKPSPVLSGEPQIEIKSQVVNGSNSEAARKMGTSVSNSRKSKGNQQNGTYSAYFSQLNNGTKDSKTATERSKDTSENVRSETNSNCNDNTSPVRTEIQKTPIRIPSLTHDSIDDDMLFDPPSIDQKRGIQRTLSEQSGGFLSPPSTRTTPRVPQDPSVQPEIPAVLPAKSSDLTTFSQRSPRWFLQNQNNNNSNLNKQLGFRPEPLKVTSKEDINSRQNRFCDADKLKSDSKLVDQTQTCDDNNKSEKGKIPVVNKQDSLLENRLKVLERYTTSSDVSGQLENEHTKTKAHANKVNDHSNEILQKLDKLSQNSSYLTHGEKEDTKEPISADWFLTPADHDTHVAASVSGSRTSSGKGHSDTKVISKKTTGDTLDDDETDLKKIDSENIPIQRNLSRNNSAHVDSGVSSPVSERTINQSGIPKTDENKTETAQRGYFSDSCVRPKTSRNNNLSDRKVSSPQMVRQTVDNSPVFKDILSGSSMSPRSNSPLLNRVNNSSSPLAGKSSKSAIKTEKIKAGAVFSPIHPQPVTTTGLAKSTMLVSKDILHSTPVTKIAASTEPNLRLSNGDDGAIDFR